MSSLKKDAFLAYKQMQIYISLFCFGLLPMVNLMWQFVARYIRGLFNEGGSTYQDFLFIVWLNKS